MSDAPADPLHRLLEVQDEDTVMDQLRHRRQHHPLRLELSELDAQGTSARSRRDELAAARDQALVHQAELESEASATESRIAALEARLYSGEVSAARDLQAMSGEVDSLRSRLGGLEEAILEAMEEAEPVVVDLARLEASLADLAARRRELAEQLARAEAELDGEERAHAESRARLAGEVPEDLLARYERLRSRLGGVAVAPLANGMCGGCHLILPATELDRIRRAAPGALLTCEQCGRILVRP